MSPSRSHRRSLSGVLSTLALALVSCGSDSAPESAGGGGASSSGGAARGGSVGSTGGSQPGSGGSGPAATGGSAGASSGCGGFCDDPFAGLGVGCCGDRCMNFENDPLNCGRCGNVCEGDTSYCNLGTCEGAPCDGAACDNAESCCGSQCCGAGQRCCLIMQGPWFTQCADLEEGTCPFGCPTCVCAAPDTPVATPSGERPISEIRVGDPVYSIHDESIRIVPVLEIRRTPVMDHRVVRVRLGSGRSLSISAPHPTADGRTFGDLAAGGTLDGVAVVAAESVPYDQPFTYDILPASETGAYFAAGVAIGSTLRK